MTIQQCKAARRIAKLDPRYQQGRKDAVRRAERLKRQIERERAVVSRKGSKGKK